MKTKDQQLLEEAYTAISESNLRSSLGHIAFVTKYENIIKELHNKKISYSEAMAKQSNLLMDIIKWMKSSSQKPIDSVEEAYIVNSIAKGSAGAGSYNSMSDEQLLDLYKNEYDKQFNAGSEAESEQLQNKIKQIYAALKQRSFKLANKASNYADQKRELER